MRTAASASGKGAGMDSRMRARRQRVRLEQSRRRRRRILSALGIVTVAGLVAVAARSPVFDLTEIRVSGVSVDRSETVTEASGLRLGDNLLFADLHAAAQQVRALPWVRDARLRRLPPSAVEIRVAQREAVVVLSQGPAAWLVDGEGVVVAGGTRPGLPQLTVPQSGPDLDAPTVGQPLGHPAVGNALAVHAALPGPLRSQVVRYDAPSVNGLRLLLDAGGTEGDPQQVWVRFGAAERVDAKARVVGLLLEEARTRMGSGGVELDVRAPDNPVLVPPGHPAGEDA